MKEPKMPTIKVEHTIRIKGLGRTFFLAICVASAIKAVDQQLTKGVFNRKDDIVKAAEKFGEKIEDEDFPNTVRDIFERTEPKKDDQA